MKTSQYVFIFLILLVGCFSCTEKTTNSLNGVWIQDGYGRVLTINDSIYTYYNTTKGSCLPLIKKGRLSDRFTIISSNAQKLVLNPGGIVNYHFTKTTKLPETCTQNKTLNVNPKENFDVLWNTFNEHYAFLKERNIDWDKLKEEYDFKVTTIQSEKELYLLFKDLLGKFNDGHIKLDIPSYLKTEVTNTIKTKRKSKDKIITDLIANYLKSSKTYNKGLVSWGKLKSVNVGYINITDMNNFIKPEINTDKLSVLQVFEQELIGVDILMKTILKDLNNTDAMVIDLRFNGGGYETVALKLLSYFVNSSKHILSVKAKKDTIYTPKQDYVLYPATVNYTKPVYLLTSAQTASAAEIFVLGALSYKNIKQYGINTQGVFSEVLWKNLPNNWEFSLSNEIYTDKNDVTYEIKGISPDVTIEIPKNKTNFYNSFYTNTGFKDVMLEEVIAVSNRK